MTMDDWMRRHADALARETGIDRAEFELDDEAIDIVLDVAAAAAHESGARTNAPLLCYLVGLAAQRGGKSLHELAAIVRSTS
jgi:Domain of unknown function (DUF6457)